MNIKDILSRVVESDLISLEENGLLFNFFQATRLIESIYLQGNKQLTYSELKKKFPIKFDSDFEVGFSPTSICKIKKNQDTSWKMTLAFMGLYGLHGALPHYFSAKITSTKDPLKKFLDVFNSKLITLLYKAWKKNRFFVNYDEARILNKESKFSNLYFDLFGLSNANSLVNLFSESEGLFSFGHMFARRSPSVDNLKKILAQYFSSPITIHENKLKKIYFNENDRTQLRMNKHNCLGRSATLGTHINDYQSQIEILVGPLSYAEYVNLLPGTPKLKKMQKIIHSYLGIEYGFLLKFILHSDDVPVMRLGKNNLGWNAWLKANPCSSQTEGFIIGAI